MHVEISQRTDQLGTENAFVVLAEVNALIKQGKNIVSFCIGQPDFDAPPAAKKAAIEAINSRKSGYTGSAGIPELRSAAAEYFSKSREMNVSSDSIVVAGGGKPFIAMAILSTTDFGKGHEIIYPVPGYPIYESQTKTAGAVPVPLYLRESKNYNFDIEELKSKINSNTRLLILNSPQNPTGGVLSKKELEEIAKVVLQYPNLWVYSDEVYSELCYDAQFESIASVPGMQERTIMVDCVSKTFAMTGWRIGYCSNPLLADAMTRWVTNLESCANHPAQWAAVGALKNAWNDVKGMKKEFHERRDLVVKLLNEIPGFKCLSPGGAFYVWPNVTKACEIVRAKDSEEFRKLLLNEAGVAVLADKHFGPSVDGEGQHIRLSYAISKQNIIEGVKRIKEFVEKSKQ
jgi:aspartate/methionine/tyrosine aminotransferase